MNYIKIKLSKRDVESIEKNLLQWWASVNVAATTPQEKLEASQLLKTYDMFRKRVKNGISEKKPYKRTETYKK